MKQFPAPQRGGDSLSGGGTSPRPSRLVSRLLSSTALAAMAICVLATSLVVSATGGVIAGQNERNARATQTTTADIGLQFELGLSDLAEGRYQLASQRFRWILERFPDYPGAAEKLAEAERLMSAGSTPEPTLPPSRTDDPEELFKEAQTLYQRQEWQNAITRLEELQRLDPRYREVEVKEMLAMSLKALGLLYVRGNRIEEGIFLLERSDAILPLDDQSRGELYLASLYVTGQTYWGLNWAVVIRNYQIIYELVPTYRDVAERLWEALVKYADQLSTQDSFCGAASQYEAALVIREDGVIREKYQAAASQCAISTQVGTAQPGTAPTFPLISTNMPSVPITPSPGPSPTPTITPLGLFP